MEGIDGLIVSLGVVSVIELVVFIVGLVVVGVVPLNSINYASPNCYCYGYLPHKEMDTMHRRMTTSTIFCFFASLANPYSYSNLGI